MRPLACGQDGLIRQGWIEYWPCTVIGMTLYYFTMAGASWWVMLTVSWFLSTSLKWSSDYLESISSYMHATVWTISAIQTIIVMITKKISGDILSGVCFVGLLDSETLLNFVIIPLALYLIIGIIMLMIGQCYSFKVKEEFEENGNKTDRLENLITRIGVFSFLYLVPSIIMIFCYIFEYVHMDNWMAHWLESLGQNNSFRNLDYEASHRTQTEDHPNITMAVLKYVAIHTRAIYSCIWIIVPNTTNSWKRWFYRRLNRHQSL